eukprot:COSAG05_NODE_11224_length_524_cov_0.896471_1_plen_34_part_10
MSQSQLIPKTTKVPGLFVNRVCHNISEGWSGAHL